SSFVPYSIRLVSGEILNDQKAIWVEPKNQVTEEQYTRFYQHLTHHTEETPLWHLHLSVDSPIQFHAVLHVRGRRVEHGVELDGRVDRQVQVPERRLFGVVRQVLVKPGVLLLGHLVLGLDPDGFLIVEDLA